MGCVRFSLSRLSLLVAVLHRQIVLRIVLQIGLFVLGLVFLFEQRRAARLLAELFIPKQPDCSIHAVITGIADHFLFA